jgi:hypothetical protein
MNLNARTAGMVIGAVFVVVGIVGFIPNPLVSTTGLFAVNTAHNLVHLLSGAAILVCALSGVATALSLQIFGVVYALVAILGFLSHGDMLLGLVRVNHADHWLHVLLALVVLTAGFLLPGERRTA